MVHSNTKNAKSRICQVCYLCTTHSSALKICCNDFVKSQDCHVVPQWCVSRTHTLGGWKLCCIKFLECMARDLGVKMPGFRNNLKARLEKGRDIIRAWESYLWASVYWELIMLCHRSLESFGDLGNLWGSMCHYFVHFSVWYYSYLIIVANHRKENKPIYTNV